jgi:PKD repeat protein
MANSFRFVLIGLTCLALIACGGGGGGGSGNRSPIASFTATPASGQAPLNVALDASASSDPDGSISSYSWNFGDNSTGTGVSTAHSYTTAGTFTVTLTVTDNRGATATTTRTVTATSGPPPASVTVSGRITFERVPFAIALGSGLEYTQTFEAPAREIDVELLLASNQTVLATMATDTNGNYSFTTTPNTDVIVRAKALTRHTGVAGGPATWDVRVRNNTNANALYVLDSSSFSTGVVNQTRNLKATTGWGGGFAGVYTGVRAAAPFAVLDTLYAAVQFLIAQGDAGVQLSPLSAYWSPSNRPSDSFNAANGDIITTLYQAGGASPGIYVLGAASNDTDEFDQHVLAHEFQHYLEDAISRGDTVGGQHSLNELLDMRVAFSEGYSNAFAAMVLNDPLYRDSFGTAQGDDFHFSIDTTATSLPGWYNEASVHRIVWDLFDATNDGADTLSVGYGPMHDVLVNELRNDVPLTSLFAFITALKQRAGVPAAPVNSLVEAESSGTKLGIVSATMTAYAATETHSGVADNSDDLVLPVYTPIALDGSARLCTASSVTSTSGTVIEGSYNKLGNRRFLRFNVPSARPIRITVNCPSSDPDCAGTIVPDPDFAVSRGRTITYADSSTPRFEQLDYAATAGDHVLGIYEWSHIDPDAPAAQRRGRTCMTVNIT